MNVFHRIRRYCVSFVVLLLHTCNHMRVRYVCSLASWSFLILLFTSSFWQLLCVLFDMSSRWQSDELPYEWSHHIPLTHCFPTSVWAIPELWPEHIATHVLPKRDLTVFIFSSQSPLPNSPYLNDPSFILQRKQVNDLLVAGLHGLVSHVIWVYPSWRRNRISDFHRVTRFQLGLASVSFADAGLSVQSKPSISNAGGGRSLPEDFSRTADGRSKFTTLCLCPTSGSSCYLPLLYSFNVNIPPETCSRNATIVYEQIIDLLVESKLVQISAENSDPHRIQPLQNLMVQWKSDDRNHRTTELPWPLNSHVAFKQWPMVFLLDANYFGSSDSESPQHPAPFPPALMKFKQLVENLLVELPDPVSSGLPPLYVLSRFLDFVIPTIPLNASLFVTKRFRQVCACDSPSLDLLATDEQAKVASMWTTMLSFPTINRVETCSRLLPVIAPLLFFDEVAPSVNTAALNLWRWLCRLNTEDLLSIINWIPCDIGSSVSAHRHISLCPRRTSIQSSTYAVPALEQSLVLDRFTSIVRHLPVPRLITMVGRPTMGLVNQLNTDYLRFLEVCDLFVGGLR